MVYSFLIKGSIVLKTLTHQIQVIFHHCQMLNQGNQTIQILLVLELFIVNYKTPVALQNMI